MTDPLNALRRSSGKSSSGLKPERAAPSVHSATRRSVGGVAVNVAGDADGAVPQEVSHGLDVHAAFQPAHGDRVAQRVHDRTRLRPTRTCVGFWTCRRWLDSSVPMDVLSSLGLN
jgi:hypothetical protein